VIGIVASRVVERYHRPTVMIALNGNEGQGSGRSVENFDLAATLESCGDHLVAFGGHKMAAGLRINANRIEAFTESFVEKANNALTAGELMPKLRLDADVDLRDLTMDAAEHIAALGPFGVGNPRPKLATDWIELASEPRCVGRSAAHLSAVFTQGGVRMRAIGFGLRDALEDLKQHRRCRVAFEPIINDFNGRRSVEMNVLDLKFPAT
jgi:single-stranded-DNA-specific exonuclease